MHIAYDDTLFSPFSVRFESRTLLLLGTLFCLAWQIAVTIFLAVIGRYDLQMYTFWSYTMQTAFYALLLFALLHQHTLFTVTVMLALPVVLANVVFVLLAIVIIIANNDEVYIKGSECAVPPGKTTMSQLHTGDFEIHVFTVFRLFVLLLAGLSYFSERIIVAQLRRWRADNRWFYFIYWVFFPLGIIVTYQWIFNVNHLYPTSFTAVQRFFILGGIAVGWQLVAWLIFTQLATPRQLHVHALPDTTSILTGALPGVGVVERAHDDPAVPTL